MENKKVDIVLEPIMLVTLPNNIHGDVIMKAYKWLTMVLLKEVNCIWLQLCNLSFVSV